MWMDMYAVCVVNNFSVVQVLGEEPQCSGGQRGRGK